MATKNYFKRLFMRVMDSWKRSNQLKLTGKSSISDSTEIIGSKLFGEVTTGNHCRIENVEMKGNIILKGNNNIYQSNLTGVITLGIGSKVIDSATLVGEIEVGRYSSINGPNTDIIAKLHPIKIGSFTSIARNVSIQEYFHDHQRLTTYFLNHNINKLDAKEDAISKGSIIIGNDVWIGTHCVILSGVNIGTGAIIAANSTVTADIPPYSIVGGSPAKIIKYRFEDKKIRELLESQWWDKPIEEIVELYKNFKTKEV